MPAPLPFSVPITFVSTGVPSTSTPGPLGVSASAGFIADHCERGKARLLVQFKNKPRLAAVLCAFLDQVQDIENALWQLWAQRVLQNAIGVQLDQLGARVGEPRQDRIDDVYRFFIGVRVLVNRSSGLPEQLIRIGKEFLADQADGVVVYRPNYPASVVLGIEQLATGLEFLDVAWTIAPAAAGGVRIQVGMDTAAESDTFRFATAPGQSDAAQGMSNTNNTATGGHLSTIHERT